jgi:hypothetical protein
MWVNFINILSALGSSFYRKDLMAKEQPGTAVSFLTIYPKQACVKTFSSLN